MTYSVYDIKVDNSLAFTPGPTAGSVLSINADGTTTFITPSTGIESVGPNTIDSVWSGTQAQYDALAPTYSTTTIYFIED
jgi:hypothetical protein